MVSNARRMWIESEFQQYTQKGNVIFGQNVIFDQFLNEIF